MSKTLYKIKKISNLGIYRSLVLLSNELFPKIILLNRDIKRTFGDEIIKNIYKSLNDLKYAYKSTEESDKILHLKSLQNNVEMVELSLKFLNETHFINDKNYTNISHLLADILLQINGWLSQYNKL